MTAPSLDVCPSAQSQAIAISVVVPTYRRFDLLNRCLTALCRQDFEGAAFEIIVADNDPDPSRQANLRKLLEARYPLTDRVPAVRYVAAAQTRGPAGARNRGWQVARGDIIAFTDDDTIPDASWLRRGRDAMSANVCAVAGRIVMPLSATPTDYERDASRLSDAEFATANCFVRRAHLEVIGGFDERFTAAWREDSDLQFSLLESGFRCGTAPDAVVVHPIRPAGWGVSVGQQRKIRYDALLYKKHRHLYRSRIRSRPPWLYYVTAALLIGALTAAVAGDVRIAVLAAIAWALLTLRLFYVRLRGNRRTVRDIAELWVTSAAIPPVAVFWRLAGAVRYRVLFL